MLIRLGLSPSSGRSRILRRFLVFFALLGGWLRLVVRLALASRRASRSCRLCLCVSSCRLVLSSRCDRLVGRGVLFFSWRSACCGGALLARHGVSSGCCSHCHLSYPCRLVSLVSSVSSRRRAGRCFLRHRFVLLVSCVVEAVLRGERFGACSAMRFSWGCCGVRPCFLCIPCRSRSWRLAGLGMRFEAAGSVSLFIISAAVMLLC